MQKLTQLLRYQEMEMEMEMEIYKNFLATMNAW